jgi:hypothetical protein
VHFEAPSTNRVAKGSLVHPELRSEHVEREQFALALMFRDDRAGASYNVGLRRPQSAVPHPEAIRGHTEECRKLLLRESDLMT